MGAWAIASLFVASILWTKGRTNAQLFQSFQSQEQESGTSGEVAEKPNSASRLQAHNGYDYFPNTNTRHEQKDDSFSIYSNFEHLFDRRSDGHNVYQKRDPTFSSQEVVEQNVESNLDQPGDNAVENSDDLVSQTTVYAGAPQDKGEYVYHQRTVPDYEVPTFHHYGKHGEVHYHKHEHVHDHKHKQGHVHKHQQEHEHKHLHEQKHGHEHHSEHKHGHHQEHQHHQEHKHEHHNSHDHKHDHHQEHKHSHEHGHKHHHSNLHKHGHHHGHKHLNKHGHKHIHHSKHY